MVINPNALGMEIPPGSMRVQPSLWYADEPARPGTWADLLPARAGAGMQPVLLVNDEKRSVAWDQTLDADQAPDDPDDHDPVETLRHLWDWVQAEDGDEDDADTIAPFTTAWPGLAPPGELRDDPDAVAARLAAELVEDGRLPGARAGLVPARRSADVLTSLGWLGACNHTDTAPLSSILRSWEDRFGIRVVALHFDRLDLSVAAPPRTMDEALAVAAEHHAFCPDNVWQEYETIREYAAEALLGKQHWTFWWD
ncbi:DUF4253 domain-containing protein [Streptomyces sp. NPDC002889]|uniref:DUF4253 domain-containing protein n=1 Tax=Streptomyces sp. NPDC002889 TaxID=3364669 RepID=UPI0036CB16D9